MAWVYGLDSSFDELTFEEAQRLKAGGLLIYMQCLWTGNTQPATRVDSLRNAQQAGLIVGGYISLNGSVRPGAWHVERAREGIPQDLWNALVRVPIDVELEGITIGQVVDAMSYAEFLGKPRDVYTSYNAWVNYVGNPTRPPGVGLWNAIWDSNPDFDFPQMQYGGWDPSEVWGEQFTGGSWIGGQWADWNNFRLEAFQPAPAPQPPPAPPTPRDCAYAGGAFATFMAEGRPVQSLHEYDKGTIKWMAAQL